MLGDWRDALGGLSVALAVLAAVVSVRPDLRGDVRPHPLSWFLFGVLSLTGYLVQRDEGARQGSWTLLAMTFICFLFVAASVARGERSFSAGVGIRRRRGRGLRPLPVHPGRQCRGRDDDGHRRARIWADVRTRVVLPSKDSVTSFAINGAKFVPSLMAMDPISFATTSYPATLLVLNMAVAVMLLLRRRALE